MGGTGRVSRRNEVSIVSPKFLGFNVAVFLTFAFGYLLLVLLFVFLPSRGTPTTAATTGGFGAGFMGGSGAVAVFALTVAMAPFIAMVTGLFTGIGTRAMVTAAVTALLGGFLGFMAVALLMLGLSLVLVGGSGTGGVVILGVVLFAIAVVTGITGATSAAISSHYQ